MRRWFSHEPDRWAAFCRRYRRELADKPDELDRLLERARSGRVTLIYAARDERHINAVVLRDYLEERLRAGPSKQEDP